MRYAPSSAHPATTAVGNAGPPRCGYSVTGAGPTVLLLHASLGSKAQWRPLAGRLQGRFRVVAVDLWGYGDNAGWPAPTPFSLDDEVELVAERLQAVLPPREATHVVGHSYGALVALRLAARSVRPIASLSLYEPVVLQLLDAPARARLEHLAQRTARLVYDGAGCDAARLFVDFWSGEGSYDSMSVERQQSLAGRMAKVPLDFTAACAWPLDAQALRDIDAPTMLMVGNRGPMMLARMIDRLADVLPDARVTAFDAGHLGPVTQPDLINPWIEAFVDRCTGPPSGALDTALRIAPWRSQGAAPAM